MITSAVTSENGHSETCWQVPDDRRHRDPSTITATGMGRAPVTPKDVSIALTTASQRRLFSSDDEMVKSYRAVQSEGDLLVGQVS